MWIAASRLAAFVRARMTRARRRILIAAALAAVLVCVILLWPMDVDPYFRLNASGEMQDRTGRLMYALLNGEQQWCFVRELSDISPHLIRATLAAEDQRFYHHIGVDPLAVLRAAWQNIWQRRIVSGASTLTMQLVKRRGRNTRSIASKLSQLIEAVRLEVRTDKRRILAGYLNSAPYGMNLVGCEAAALRFYGKPARELTLPEAALLAGLPKSPTAYTPFKHPEAARKRRDYVLRRMCRAGYITAGEYDRARAEPLGVAWHPVPALAPHLAMRLKPEIVRRGKLRTTLEYGTQRRAESELQRWVEGFGRDVRNGAVIVVDVPSASVLARVGSGDFSDTATAGQVDGCSAPRSPGSALKPFTYAFAMERNCLYGSETLLDMSLDYGLYNPENFDRDYRGLVSASDALRLSLNIPAITILERVGTQHIHTLLCEMGLSTLSRSPQDYGLGLVLGDCEVRLDEMAAAYCALARLGEYQPLTVDGEASAPLTRRLLSRGTCVALYEMLEQPLPEELDSDGGQAVGVRPRACWKTGTSTGQHDAWAFIFNRQYLVAVWIGNFDGAPSRRLVGAEAALPLAARMFRTLKPKTAATWPEAGDDLREARICAVSGLPASPWCKDVRHTLLPRNQYLNRICDMHYPAGVATSDGQRRVVERWPGSARGWNLACVAAGGTPIVVGKRTLRDSIQSFRIITPASRAEYVLTGEPDGDRLTLRASRDDETLHWYLDDQFLGSSTPQCPVVLPLKPGSHKLVSMMPDGATDQVEFQVVLPGSSMRFRN